MKTGGVRATLVVILLVMAAAIIEARAKRMRVDSRWRDVDVIVDGAATEWRDPLLRFNDQPLSFAATNDGEFLYVVLVASEPQARMQILRQGLIVWFDAAGGDKKRLGIKYPIGRGFEGSRGPRGESGREAHADRPEGRGDQTIEPPNRLEVLGPGKDDARSYTADRAPGIEVKAAQAEGILTYELKVPLQTSDARPHAIGAKPGATIGLGLEMPKLEMSEEGSRRRGGMGGTGGGGMGGGRIGGRGGMAGRRGSGRNFEPPKPLNGWVSLQLAATSGL